MGQRTETEQSVEVSRKRHPGTVREVLGAALRLGTTSFGGPIAHLGYFHEEYVVRRKWLDEEKYADLVAFCQMIPGPASSQLGIAIGMGRAGPLGGIAAWLGFTLPSAVAMVVFAFLQHGSNVTSAGWLHGLLVVAVAVVAQAVWAMSRSLASDLPHISLAIAAAIVSLLRPSSLTQLLLIASGAIGGSLLFRALPNATPTDNRAPSSEGHAAALACLGVFALLLVGLPVLRGLTHSQTIALIDSFYRSGSLVFGGGHVVLPLLRQEVVPPGWVSDATFLSGYGAAQAVPGPLFTFAAYLGAVSAHAPSGIAGAA
jgi:chromate transporter